MPTIAVRPSLRDYDDSNNKSTGPRGSLALRAKVALRSRALVRDLATGPAEVSPELTVRASKLVSNRHRHQLAKTLRRTIEEAHQPATRRANFSIIDRRAVLDAEPEIETLIGHLSSYEPVAAQGVAMVEMLITDGGKSPLYGETKLSHLRQQVVAATTALELERESEALPIAA
jgi:hypothetical protein